MKVIDQKVELLSMTPDAIQLIESAGRTCWKSEGKITDGSAEKFVAMIIKRGHESVLEHASATMRITTDRGISHEIVRHRIGMSYSQESTRYVRYNDDTEFINAFGIESAPARAVWTLVMNISAAAYACLIAMGVSPQWARSVLPSSTKTEIVVTGNLRAWRHFIRLRQASGAHPQIRELAAMAKALLPNCITEDL